MNNVVSIDRARESHLQRSYGIGVADYERMQREQGNRCAGCGWSPRPDQRRLHVDHNHKTGKVRGLLCWKCNSALKKLRDDPQIAYNLAVFLARGDGKRFTVLSDSGRGFSICQPTAIAVGTSADDPRGD